MIFWGAVQIQTSDPTIQIHTGRHHRTPLIKARNQARGTPHNPVYREGSSSDVEDPCEENTRGKTTCRRNKLH